MNGCARDAGRPLSWLESYRDVGALVDELYQLKVFCREIAKQLEFRIPRSRPVRARPCCWLFLFLFLFSLFPFSLPEILNDSSPDPCAFNRRAYCLR